MSLSFSPSVVTNGLKLYYDLGNTKKSFKGSPTTNLITYPLVASVGGGVGSLTYNSNDESYTWIRTGYETWGAYVYFNPSFTGNLDTTKQYTISFKWKSNSDFTDNNFQYGLVQGNGVSPVVATYISTSSTLLYDGWNLFSYTFTPTNSGVGSAYNRVIVPSLGTAVTRFTIKEIQLEQTPYRTSFVKGTRSSSQSVKDMTNTTVLDVTNASFDASGNVIFNASTSHMRNAAPISYRNSSCIEYVFNANSLPVSLNTPSTTTVYTLVGYSGIDGYGLSPTGLTYLMNNGRIELDVITASQGYRSITSSTVFQTGKNYHVVFNKNTTTGILELYVNGVLDSSQTFDSVTYGQWPSAGNYLDTAITGTASAAANKSLTTSISSAPNDSLVGKTITITGGTGAGQTRNIVASRFNLIGYTQSFDDASWIKGEGETVTANATTAPDGTLTADLFTPATLGNATGVTASTANRIWKEISVPNSTFTNSIYVLSGGTNGTASIYVVDRATDLVISQFSVTTSNSWQRISVSGLTNSTVTPGVRFVFSSSYATYIWGAQCQTGGLTEYFRNDGISRLGVAVDTPWTTMPDATSTYSISGDTLDIGYTASSNPYFAEQSATNICLQSNQLATSPWFASTGVTLTANGDGSWTITTTTGLFVHRQLITVTPSTTYTWSFYAKRGTATDAKFSIFDNTNQADIVASTSYYSTINSSGFTRVTVTFTTPATCTSIGCYTDRDSQVTGTVIVRDAQLELGTYASSVITTTTVPVTRGTIPTSYFDGTIPIVKMYNRTLTASEVAQNFDALKDRFNF